MVKIPRPHLALRDLTALAIGCGAGAAVGAGLVAPYLALPAAGFALLLDRRRKWFYLAGLILCLLSGAGQRLAAARPGVSAPDRGCRLTGELICTDRRTTALTELPQPSLLRCEVVAAGRRYPAAAILPKTAPRMLCGDRAGFSGRLLPAAPAGLEFNGASVTAPLPPLYGDRPLLLIDTLRRHPPRRNFWGAVFTVRDFLLRRLLCRVEDPAVRAMAAKMFFNAGTGAPRELNTAFAASGTIHLFAVSGLHVAVLTGLLLWLMRPLPFAQRYLLAAAAIPGYVLCTGAALPAIRAGVMLGVWCLLRGFLLYAPGWHAMMLTWCAFALISPETVGSLGAQYSFGITAALILGMEKLHDLFQRDRELLHLMPRRAALTAARYRFFRRKHRLVTGAAVAVIAFAAAAGISLRRQQLLIPGSIVANLLLPLLTPALFGAMILKLTLAGTLPLLDRAAAALLEWGFRMLAAWTGAAAQWFGPVAAVTPPSWYVAVFYLLLFTALGVRRPTVSRFAGIGAAAMLAILPLIKAASPGQVTVINHGANTPALLAYLPPGGEVAEIVDVPDSAVGALAGRELRQQGALRARIGFSRGTRDSDRGAAALARQLPATAFLPDGQRLSAAFRRNLQADNLKVRENLHTIRVRAPRPGAVEWRTADGTEIAATSGDNGRTVRIRTRSGRVISATLPWSSLPVRWRCLTE